MPLQKQLLPVYLKGLQNKRDPKAPGVQGVLELVQNAYPVRTAGDGVEYVKRYGHTVLPRTIVGGLSISDGVRLHTYDNGLILQTADKLYSYGDTNDKWSDLGSYAQFTAGVSPIDAPAAATFGNSITSNDINTDACYHQGIALYVWADDGATRSLAIDTTTGVRLGSVGISGRRPRIVATGGNFYVFTWNGTNNLTCFKIPVSDPTNGGTSATVATNVNATTPNFDVTVNTAAGTILVAYHSTGSDVRSVVWTTSMASSATQTYASAEGDLCMGWLHHDYASTANAYLATCGSGAYGVRYLTLTASNLAFGSESTVEAAANTARNVTGYYNSGAVVFYEIPNATSYNHRIKRNGAEYLRGHGLTSKAWKHGTKYFCLVGFRSTTQGTVFAVELGTSAPMAVSKTSAGAACAHTATDGVLPSVTAMSATKYLSAIVREERVFFVTTLRLMEPGVYSVTFDADETILSGHRVVADTLMFPGGITRMFDGKSFVEHGFHAYPEQPTLTANTIGAMATGTYYYQVIYTWTDERGRVHRSAPSVAKAVTLLAGQDSVTITIPTLRLTAKSQVGVEVFRTTVGGTSLFYRLGIYTANLTAADTVSFEDVQADSEITGNELLYTVGGVLDHVGPPSSLAVQTYRDRVFLISSENPNELWFSKPLRPSEAPGFNEDLVVTLDSSDGSSVALAELDDRLVAFKRSAAYVLAGDGPNALGQGSYDNPQRLGGATGCSEPRSIAVTPEGLMRKTARGIFTLTRAFTDEYSGAAVEDYNAITITGAVIMDALNQVRFVSSDGTTLVYDWYFKQWVTFTNQAAVSAAIWRNTYTFLASDGKVKVESTAYLDDATVVRAKWRTSWLVPFGLGARGRLYAVQILGKYVATADEIDLTYEFDFKEGNVFPARGIGQPDDNPFYYESKPPQQRMTSVRLTIDDFLTTVPGASFRLTGLALEVGVKPGRHRLAAAMRMP